MLLDAHVCIHIRSGPRSSRICLTDMCGWYGGIRTTQVTWGLFLAKWGLALRGAEGEVSERLSLCNQALIHGERKPTLPPCVCVCVGFPFDKHDE